MKLFKILTFSFCCMFSNAIFSAGFAAAADRAAINQSAGDKIFDIIDILHAIKNPASAASPSVASASKPSTTPPVTYSKVALKAMTSYSQIKTALSLNETAPSIFTAYSTSGSYPSYFNINIGNVGFAFFSNPWNANEPSLSSLVNGFNLSGLPWATGVQVVILAFSSTDTYIPSISTTPAATPSYFEIFFYDVANQGKLLASGSLNINLSATSLSGGDFSEGTAVVNYAASAGTALQVSLGVGSGSDASVNYPGSFELIYSANGKMPATSTAPQNLIVGGSIKAGIDGTLTQLYPSPVASDGTFDEILLNATLTQAVNGALAQGHTVYVSFTTSQVSCSIEDGTSLGTQAITLSKTSGKTITVVNFTIMNSGSAERILSSAAQNSSATIILTQNKPAITPQSLIVGGSIKAGIDGTLTQLYPSPVASDGTFDEILLNATLTQAVNGALAQGHTVYVSFTTSQVSCSIEDGTSLGTQAITLSKTSGKTITVVNFTIMNSGSAERILSSAAQNSSATIILTQNKPAITPQSLIVGGSVKSGINGTLAQFWASPVASDGTFDEILFNAALTQAVNGALAQGHTVYASFTTSQVSCSIEDGTSLGTQAITLSKTSGKTITKVNFNLFDIKYPKGNVLPCAAQNSSATIVLTQVSAAVPVTLKPAANIPATSFAVQNGQMAWASNSAYAILPNQPAFNASLSTGVGGLVTSVDNVNFVPLSAPTLSSINITLYQSDNKTPYAIFALDAASFAQIPASVLSAGLYVVVQYRWSASLNLPTISILLADAQGNYYYRDSLQYGAIANTNNNAAPVPTSYAVQLNGSSSLTTSAIPLTGASEFKSVLIKQTTA